MFSLAVAFIGCSSGGSFQASHSDGAPTSATSAANPQNLSVTKVATNIANASYTVTSSAASSSLWPLHNGVDGNKATIWSSNTHGTGAATEWYAYWFAGLNPVNYIRLSPRFNTANMAEGFPINFSIYCSTGSQWVSARKVTNMQTPYRNSDIVLALPNTMNCNGIQIVATNLGPDFAGNYVFQMGEFGAGYDNTFSQFSWVGNDGSANRATIRNVGSGAFNPNKVKHWNYDARNPVIVPNNGSFMNIYAPSIVQNGASWNIYFGGWDGTSSGHDQISLTVSGDNFNTFGAHSLMIANGQFNHVNNETVIKVGTNNWQMAYTTDASLNKPGYATSTNGVNWNPSSGTTSKLMTMSGYPNWSSADVNGSNVIYFDGSQYHMYFDNFAAGGLHTYHATSANNENYDYVSQTAPAGVITNDLKSFVYNGTRYYMWGYHHNGNTILSSIGTDIANPPAATTLFSSAGSADQYMTSVGYVTDGTRLWGAFYGAGSVSTLDHNRIFASWLQKKIVFSNPETVLAGEQADGPNTLYNSMVANNGTETGVFQTFDTDGTTLLNATSDVTLLAGDIWQCNF